MTEPTPTTGAQKRKRAARKLEALEAAEQDDGIWALEFAEAGKPDLDNPGTDLDYVRKLQLICLRQMACTAKPSLNQQACWRRIREMSAVVGMTSNRAQLESKVKKLEAELQSYRAPGASRDVAGKDLKRPMRTRGPRPVDVEPPEPLTEPDLTHTEPEG